MQESPKTSSLARFAGAFLLAAAFFAVAAVVVGGTFGPRSPWMWGLAALGLLGLVLWFVGRQNEAKLGDQRSRQRTFLGLNALFSVLITLVLLVGVNYIAARRHKTFDLTKNRLNSLAPQTEKALQELPGNVRLSYFYVGAPGGGKDQSLLDAYKNASDKVQVERVDLASEPLKAPPTFAGQPMMVAQLQSPDPKKPGEKQEITVIDEQNVTSALLKLRAKKTLTGYYVTGFGESDWNQSPSFNALLASQNFSFRPLSLLAASAKVPADASIVVLEGPQLDLTPAAAQTLGEYLAHKGHLVVLLAPARAAQPNLNGLLKKLGVEVVPGLVLDFHQAVGSPANVVGLLQDRAKHPILRGTTKEVVFPSSVALRPTAQNGITPVFETSAGARAAQTEADIQTGPVGPFVLAGAKEVGSGRALVIASHNLTNERVWGVLSSYGNPSFMTSGFNWVAGNDALVSIPPKPETSDTLAMSDATFRFVSLMGLFALPLAALALGAVIWWRRR